MKHILVLFFFVISTVSFAQQTGSISGKLTDNEYNNTPLALGTVLVKGSDLKATTDDNGSFVFQNLKDGTYTLICSFIGYESKEVLVAVESGSMAEVKLSLSASTVSLDDLMILASVEKVDSPILATN